MLNLTIPIPNLPGKQDIEIEMKMNGHRQKLRYRVEVIDWTECLVTEGNDRVDCIRDLINEYDQDWMIYHIGAPGEDYVPLTFIHKEDWAAQHRWLWGEMTV
jgi:hypothetical protein